MIFSNQLRIPSTYKFTLCMLLTIWLPKETPFGVSTYVLYLCITVGILHRGSLLKIKFYSQSRWSCNESRQEAHSRTSIPKRDTTGRDGERRERVRGQKELATKDTSKYWNFLYVKYNRTSLKPSLERSSCFILWMYNVTLSIHHRSYVL